MRQDVEGLDDLLGPVEPVGMRRKAEIIGLTLVDNERREYVG